MKPLSDIEAQILTEFELIRTMDDGDAWVDRKRTKSFLSRALSTYRTAILEDIKAMKDNGQGIQETNEDEAYIRGWNSALAYLRDTLLAGDKGEQKKGRIITQHKDDPPQVAEYDQPPHP